jgi:hypothetical protein
MLPRWRQDQAPVGLPVSIRYVEAVAHAGGRRDAGRDMRPAGGMKVPRLQILTAAQILDNRRPQVPF